MRIPVMVVGVVALLVGVALPSRSEACSCMADVPICETFWSTPLVFSGTVLEITQSPATATDRRRLGYGRVVRFRVSQSWKGETGATVEINTGMGGGDCGYNFVTGREYLVYAGASAAGYSTGICSRTRALSAAAEDLRYLEAALQRPASGRIFGDVLVSRASDLSPKPGAGYTVTLEQGEKKWAVTTGGDGKYEFRDIPAGAYQITVLVQATEKVFGPATTELVDSRGCAAAHFRVVADGEPPPGGIPMGRWIPESRLPQGR